MTEPPKAEHDVLGLCVQ